MNIHHQHLSIGWYFQRVNIEDIRNTYGIWKTEISTVFLMLIENVDAILGKNNQIVPICKKHWVSEHPNQLNFRLT